MAAHKISIMQESQNIFTSLFIKKPIKEHGLEISTAQSVSLD